VHGIAQRDERGTRWIGLWNIGLRGEERLLHGEHGQHGDAR
jgi:hypothetical protein